MKSNMTMPQDPQSAPDVDFLRNTGIALFALTVAAGAIAVVGSLKTVEPTVLAQSVGAFAQSNDSALAPVEVNVSP